VNSDITIKLLGPFEVLRDNAPTPVTRGRWAVVLASLALSVGRPVGQATLGELVWGSRLPQSTAGSLQTHVLRLRQALGADTIRTVPSGYLLDLAPERIDLWRFRRLVTEAAVARQPEKKRELLDEALALWRGEPLHGLPSDLLRRDVVPALLDERQAALDSVIDLEFAVGRYAESIVELRATVARHPLREASWQRLITALAAVGRNAEALDCYNEIRMMLRGQLGVDPSVELRELYQRLLAASAESADDEADAAAARPAVALTEVSAPPAIPERIEPDLSPAPRSDLPADIADLTGRDQEINHLLAQLPDDLSTSGPPSVLMIDGMAGVGKTTLAVHLAHRLTERCPDGQIFLDLRGHTPGHEPVRPPAALASLLAAVGVGGDQIPESVDERAALWRAKVVDRRMLLVLDNAATAAQVRPLLPGRGSSVVLVTSRRRLMSLDAARALSLDVLSPADAMALLGEIVGMRRLAAEPDAASEVLRFCGHLPLAIRIVGARLAARPVWTLEYLAERLRDQRHRLAELAVEDHSVAAAFGVSYQQLPNELRHLFRVLGSHPGHDFDVHLAAAIAGIDTASAERGLEDLLDMHLLAQPAMGRYRFHDLLRDHARQAAEQADARQDQQAAIGRMLDYYLFMAERSSALIAPGRRRFATRIAHPPAGAPMLADQADALAWYERERPNLVAVTHFASTNGWPTHAWQIPLLLWDFFLLRGHLQDWLVTTHAALSVIDAATDPQALPETMKSLAGAYFHTGKYDKALDLTQRALDEYLTNGDLDGQAATLGNLGVLRSCAGRYGEAVRHHRQALELYQRAKAARGVEGRLQGEGANLLHLGNALVKLGRYDEAIRCHRSAVDIYQQLGDRRGEGAATVYLALAYQRSGRYATALLHHRRALRFSQDAGDRSGTAVTLNHLAVLHRHRGDLTQALDLHRRSLDLIREIGERSSEAEILNDYATTLFEAGERGAANAHYLQALRLSTRALNRYEQARAHDGLARTLSANHHMLAHRIFAELGVPEASAGAGDGTSVVSKRAVG
jgi:DNA-binding SARP family transcriptional activator